MGREGWLCLQLKNNQCMALIQSIVLSAHPPFSIYYRIDKFIEKTKKSPDEAGTFKADESGYVFFGIVNYFISKFLVVTFVNICTCYCFWKNCASFEMSLWATVSYYLGVKGGGVIFSIFLFFSHPKWSSMIRNHPFWVWTLFWLSLKCQKHRFLGQKRRFLAVWGSRTP